MQRRGITFQQFSLCLRISFRIGWTQRALIRLNFTLGFTRGLHWKAFRKLGSIAISVMLSWPFLEVKKNGLLIYFATYLMPGTQNGQILLGSQAILREDPCQWEFQGTKIVKNSFLAICRNPVPPHRLVPGQSSTFPREVTNKCVPLQQGTQDQLQPLMRL